MTKEELKLIELEIKESWNQFNKEIRSIKEEIKDIHSQLQTLQSDTAVFHLPNNPEKNK